MIDILIRSTYTPRQEKQAQLERDKFRRNRYTSGYANLDDMVQLGKAVILCQTHVRKFEPKRARYQAHPQKNLRRVFGECDICKIHELSFLFINDRDADEERKKLEKYQRAMEYRALLR